MKYLYMVAALVAGFVGANWWAHRGAVEAAKESSDWLPWLGLLFDVLGKADWLSVLMIGTGFLILALLMIAQFRPGDGFDLRSLVARRERIDGAVYWTLEPGKTWQAGGFCVTTLGFIVLIGKGLLSDLYLMIYSVAWLASPALNQIVASKFPVTPGTALPDIAPPAPPSVVTTTTTEVKQ